MVYAKFACFIVVLTFNPTIKLSLDNSEKKQTISFYNIQSEIENKNKYNTCKKNIRDSLQNLLDYMVAIDFYYTNIMRYSEITIPTLQVNYSHVLSSLRMTLYQYVVKNNIQIRLR